MGLFTVSYLHGLSRKSPDRSVRILFFSMQLLANADLLFKRAAILKVYYSVDSFFCKTVFDILVLRLQCAREITTNIGQYMAKSHGRKCGGAFCVPAECNGVMLLLLAMR